MPGGAGESSEPRGVDDLVGHQDVLEPFASENLGFVGGRAGHANATAGIDLPLQEPGAFVRLEMRTQLRRALGEEVGSPRNIAVGRREIDDEAGRGKPRSEFPGEGHRCSGGSFGNRPVGRGAAVRE